MPSGRPFRPREPPPGSMPVPEILAAAAAACAGMAEQAYREATIAAELLRRVQGATPRASTAQLEAASVWAATSLARDAAQRGDLDAAEEQLARARAHRDAALRIMEEAIRQYRKRP